MTPKEPDKAPGHEPDDTRADGDHRVRVNRRNFMQMGGAAVAGAGMIGVGAASASSLQGSATPDASVTPEASAAVAEPAPQYQAEAPWTGELGTGSALPPNIPPWMQTWGPLPGAYGERSPHEDHVVRVPNAEINPAWSFTPLQDLHGTMTPNSLFFERHHAGIPQIDPAEHRLMVHGMVETPLIFTMDDIKRFPATSVTHFLECSGNSLYEWSEAAPTRRRPGCSPRARMRPAWTAASRWRRRWMTRCSPTP